MLREPLIAGVGLDDTARVVSLLRSHRAMLDELEELLTECADDQRIVIAVKGLMLSAAYLNQLFSPRNDCPDTRQD